jgi:hypothetical protein
VALGIQEAVAMLYSLKSLKRIATEIMTTLKRYEGSDYARTKAYRLLERVLTDQTIIIDEQLEIKENKAKLDYNPEAVKAYTHNLGRFVSATNDRSLNAK